MSDNQKNRIHIFSGAGAGSTTLGKNIAIAKNIVHYDADNYIWKGDCHDYQYRKLRNPIERNSLLDRDLRIESSWVLSGRVCGWGDFAIPLFDVVIFLDVPHKERMNRYVSRNIKRHGNDLLKTKHPLHNIFILFKNWASSYEDGQNAVYSKNIHEKWIEKLLCPVVRIEGNFTAEQTLNIALKKISQL